MLELKNFKLKSFFFLCVIYDAFMFLDSAKFLALKKWRSNAELVRGTPV